MLIGTLPAKEELELDGKRNGHVCILLDSEWNVLYSIPLKPYAIQLSVNNIFRFRLPIALFTLNNCCENNSAIIHGFFMAV